MEKRSKLFIVILVLLVLVPTSAAQKSSTIKYLDALHNQGKERVIVRFEDKIDINSVKKHQAKLIRKLKIINSVVCEIDQDKIELLRQEKGVKDVMPDVVIRLPEPVETKAEQITSRSYDGDVEVRWNNLEAGVNSKGAWDNYGLDGTGIKIAVLDTGVNYTLPDLNANYLGGEDFVEDDGDPFTDNVEEDHGTKVVSLVAGEGESQIVGVAYNASYYAVRVFDENGVGLVGDSMSGIEWAFTEPHKADVISMSFVIYDKDQSGNPLWPTIKAAYENVCNNAYNAGVILVAGSGNNGYTYSGYPAAFPNVISAGGHAEDQTLYDYNGKSSCGGVDIVAPAAKVAAIKPDNSTWWVWGTSYAAPHASALIALQLQYARENNLEPNNGYLWEVMKHSAVDIPLIPDPVYKGEGKIYAAQTDANDVNFGSIDLIASNWPIEYEFEFNDYAFIDSNSPVYRLGEDINQSITLANITHTIGNDVENIENLTVTATQTEYDDPNSLLGGNSVKVFPTITALEPSDANSIELSYSYTIPPDTTPGMKKTTLQMEFNFVGNSRTIRVTYNNPDSAWYAAIPADLDLSNSVGLTDFAMFALQWQLAGCIEPEWCGRADIDRSGGVDGLDLKALADNWLSGL